MTKKTYCLIWAGLFILCAGLGFIPEPAGFLKFCMTALSVAFFLPPAALLYFAGQKNDRLTISIIRNLALASLGLTLAAIVANFLSLMAPESVGNFLYALLIVISSPMVCSGYWVLSLFLWACLLMGAISLLRKK